MSSPHYPLAVTFFSGLLFRGDLLEESTILEICRDLFQGNVSEFFFIEEASLTQYYEKEMGDRHKLRRAWVYGEQLADRSGLVDIKDRANKVELQLQKEFKSEGRVVNIDPGYLALEQIVLATNKPYSHRLYLGEGIYGDLVYQYQQKEWRTLPWTYPDYQNQQVIEYFLKLRERHSLTLRSKKDQ